MQQRGLIGFKTMQWKFITFEQKIKVLTVKSFKQYIESLEYSQIVKVTVTIIQVLNNILKVQNKDNRRHLSFTKCLNNVVEVQNGMKFWETPATKKVLNNILKVQNNGWHDKFDPKKKFKIMQWKFRTTRARKKQRHFCCFKQYNESLE